MSLELVRDELGLANEHLTGAWLAVGDLEIDDTPTEILRRIRDAQAAVIRAGTVVAHELAKDRAA